MSTRRISGQPLKEDELRNPVKKLFPADDYLAKDEVPFEHKRIDLVFKERDNGQQLIAVELKIRDWKRAVWQALHTRQVATYSYVALYERFAPSVDQELLQTLGLGLISADRNSARFLIPAKKSQHINKRFSEKVSLFIENNTYV